MAMLDGPSTESAPRYEASGWMHWPDHEEHSAQFTKLLGAAQDGTSSVSECFKTASRIMPGDDESWCVEWRTLAFKIREAGNRAFGLGHRETANYHWLRALQYFRAAQFFLSSSDPRKFELFEQAEACAASYLGNFLPKGEFVKIPHEGNFLSGYFLRASSHGYSPVTLCFGGPEETKEDQLLKLSCHALARGISLLVVDLPGQGATFFRNRISDRHDQEVAISHCVDYLVERTDIDKKGIVLYGEGLGGAFASRAACVDGRFAAAVCDGGIWDQKERHFLKDWLWDSPHRPTHRKSTYDVAARIRCPFLVAVGEHDYIDAEDVIGLHRHCRDAGIKMDMKVFSEEETGASHCQLDNPTMGKGFIFDWIASKVGLVKGESAARESRKKIGSFRPHASSSA